MNWKRRYNLWSVVSAPFVWGARGAAAGGRWIAANAYGVVHGAIAVLAIGLIAYGCFSVWRPLGFLVPGALLWYDVTKRRR